MDYDMSYFIQNSQWFYFDNDGRLCIKENAPVEAVNEYQEFLKSLG